MTAIAALKSTNHVILCRIATSLVSSAFAGLKTPGHNRTPGWEGSSCKGQNYGSWPRRSRIPCFTVTYRRDTIPGSGVWKPANQSGRVMDKPSPGTPPPIRPLEDRLDSWKEIAAYLSRDVTTVQRWEKREGMPVHRHLHDRLGSVYASRAELDEWARSRNLRATQESGNHASLSNSPASPPSPAIWDSVTRRRSLLALGAVVAALGIPAIFWFHTTEYFWRNPVAAARFQTVTDFDATEQAATVSRDGHFVAFLSDRDGQMDVWVTQVGSGQFHNLTRGSAPELVNPSVRALGFAPDGSLVTF